MESRIEPTSRQAIYRQLSEQIREAIATGRLAEGEKLPSVRELSRTLVVNPNTIARVYTELERDGVLNTRPGLGVLVAPARPAAGDARPNPLDFLVPNVLSAPVSLGSFLGSFRPVPRAPLAFPSLSNDCTYVPISVPLLFLPLPPEEDSLPWSPCPARPPPSIARANRAPRPFIA